jgi:hypothetical protein
MKKKKTFLAFFLIATVALAASGKTLSYTMVQQAMSNWCWAASAENSAKGYHEGSLNLSRTQWDAVHAIKGNSSMQYPNVGGTNGDADTAAEYISNNNLIYDHTGTSVTSGVKSFSFLKSEIDAEEVPILSAGYYNSSGNRTGGHDVTMYGYFENGSTQQIRFYDPANGNTYYISYNSFKNGCSSTNYRIYDGTIWVFGTNN